MTSSPSWRRCVQAGGSSRPTTAAGRRSAPSRRAAGRGPSSRPAKSMSNSTLRRAPAPRRSGRAGCRSGCRRPRPIPERVILDHHLERAVADEAGSRGCRARPDAGRGGGADRQVQVVVVGHQAAGQRGLAHASTGHRPSAAGRACVHADYLDILEPVPGIARSWPSDPGRCSGQGQRRLAVKVLASAA